MKIPFPSTLEIPGIHQPIIKQKYSYSIKIEFDF